MSECSEQPGGPTLTQATYTDESDQVNRLAARMKELHLVNVHTCAHVRTHTTTHTHTRTLCLLYILALLWPSYPILPSYHILSETKLHSSMNGLTPQDLMKNNKNVAQRQETQERSTGSEPCVKHGPYLLYLVIACLCVHTYVST